jgi:hypothetical protein
MNSKRIVAAATMRKYDTWLSDLKGKYETLDLFFFLSSSILPKKHKGPSI